MSDRLPAAERLLRTAASLFAREGIRSVGIDRILAEAGVAKATLYQHFGSKEALVLAYLERRDIEDRQRYRAATAALAGRSSGAAVTGRDRVLASFDLAVQAARSGDYLGCAYANALTEFPDPAGPVAEAVRDHRAWLRGQWREACEEDRADRDHAADLAEDRAAARAERAEHLCDRVQLVYDGALLGAKAARSERPVLLARELVRGWFEVGGLGDACCDTCVDTCGDAVGDPA